MNKKVLFFLSVFFAFSCVKKQSVDEWVVATEGAFPPFNYVDEKGNLSGFDVDFALELCQILKKRCTLVSQKWDGIIPGLLSKKYDLIIASMSITEERKKKVAFSIPYYSSGAVFVGRKGEAFEKSKSFLQGKTIGVTRASTFDAYVSGEFKDIVQIK